MATSTNYLGYNTYILGTTKSILMCLGIIVYNKSQLPSDIEKLSLYNIDQVYQKVIQSGEYLRLDRLSTEDPFIYTNNNGVVQGFDTIIYLSNSDNTSIGYTEFLNIQGEDRNINIQLAFNNVISGDLVIDLVNSLTQLKNNPTVSTDFIGKELNQYPSAKNIHDDISNSTWNSPKYTSNLSSIYKSNTQNIFLGYGLLKGTQLIKLDLSKNMVVDPYEFGFTNYLFGYYEGDIVVYLWKGLDYTIYSITKRNRYNNPITYINSGVGYATIPNYSTTENTQQKISYFAGKYAVVELSGSENSTQIYDTMSKGWLKLNSPNFIIETTNLKNRIVELPIITNYNNVFDYLPDISNIYLNLYEYTRTNSLNISKKVRNWYVIRRKRDKINIYSGMSKTLFCSDQEEPIIINDQIIMIRTKDEENNLDYYTVYNENQKTYYSEKARVIIEGGKLEFNSSLGIMFCNGGSRDEEYKSLYNTKEIKIIDSGETLNNSYFVRFRRNILPENITTIPEIVGAIDGIIFYKNQNYINYL